MMWNECSWKIVAESDTAIINNRNMPMKLCCAHIEQVISEFKNYTVASKKVIARAVTEGLIMK